MGDMPDDEDLDDDGASFEKCLPRFGVTAARRLSERQRAIDRFLCALERSAARSLFERLDTVDVSALVLPVFKCWARDDRRAKVVGAAHFLREDLRTLTMNVEILAVRVQNYPEPNGGRDLDLPLGMIVSNLAGIYMRLTGRRAGRGVYRDKGRAYGFQKFLSETFDALGIEASAEKCARRAANRHRKRLAA